MNRYVLVTTPEEMIEFDKVYLSDKKGVMSYITPDSIDALHFESRKQAYFFMRLHKMNFDLWRVEKVKRN